MNRYLLVGARKSRVKDAAEALDKERFGRLLKKKEALCAVAVKLIKVIFALLRVKQEIQDTGVCSGGRNERVFVAE